MIKINLRPSGWLNDHNRLVKIMVQIPEFDGNHFHTVLTMCVPMKKSH